jgi:tryptophan synthase
MASALQAAFAAKKPAFVGYVTGGFPTKADTVPAMLAMQESGVDVIEVGVPFSDPLADGGVIQKANQLALTNGVHLGDCIAAVREARSKGLTVPVVLMGYYNPFLRYGEGKLVDECAEAGVNGFIVVDLPLEECASFLSHCDRKELAFVPLVAPTTEESRLAKIAAVGRGFVYCVSVTGVTGARTELPTDLADFVARVKAHIKLPVAVGFGISTRAQVESVGKVADGVVMGSAIVTKLQTEGVEGLRAFLTALLK